MIPASGCSPLSVNFPPVLGITSYSWNFGDGATSGTQNPSHTYTNTTTTTIVYSVSLIASNAFGCIDTAYGMPVVHPKPTANFAMTPTLGCSPMAVNFSNSSTLSFNNAWTFGNGNSSNLTNPSTTYTTSNTSGNTTFPVKLVVTSVNNCKDSITNNVTLYPKPDAGFGVDTPACSPKVLSFTNSSQGATTFNWSFGNGNTSTVSSPTQQYINNTSFNQTYTVQLIAANANNCTDTVKAPIIIHSQPNFNIIATPDSGCTNLNVNFPSIIGAVNYSWNFGDGNAGSTGNINHTFVNTTTTPRQYTVQLIASDQYGCPDTATKVIKVFPKPVALFQVNPTTVFIPDQPVNCINLSSGNNGGNQWTFGDGGTSSEVNPSHIYTTEGQYQIVLIVTNIHGCKDTFSLPEKIIAIGESSFDIPNAFTPNPAGGNGGSFDPYAMNNDVFHPVIKGVDKYQMSIYSRWGELLFETKDLNIGWDGYYKGKMCTQDVYVWKINATMIDGTVLRKTGDVILLK
jgi:gliding motility-associated-like protein